MSFDGCLEVLEDNRDKLTHGIIPRWFPDELRENSVLSREDCQDFLNDYKYPTDVEKIGRLLDLIRTKGPRGGKNFMDIVGKNNPDLYEQVMKKKVPEDLRSIDSGPSRICNCQTNVKLYLDQLTEAVVKNEKLEQEYQKLKQAHSSTQYKYKEQHNLLLDLKKLNKTLKSHNEDRKRIEAERNDIMEKHNAALGKALHYKEELDIAITNLRKCQFEIHQLKRDLNQAKKQAELQRQKSHHFETSLNKSRSLIANHSLLESKVQELQSELNKQRGDNQRLSLAVGSSPSPDKVVDHMQVHMEILKSDLQDAHKKNEDATQELYERIQELDLLELDFQKLLEDRDDLRVALDSHKEETKMQKNFRELAEAQLDSVVGERNAAFEAQNEQTKKCARLIRERDNLFKEQRELRDMLTDLHHKHSSAVRIRERLNRKLRERNAENPEGDEISVETTEESSVTDDLLDQPDPQSPAPAEILPTDSSSARTSNEASHRNSSSTDPKSHRSSSEFENITTRELETGPTSKPHRPRGIQLPKDSARAHKRRVPISPSAPLEEIPFNGAYRSGSTSEEDSLEESPFSAKQDSTRVHISRNSTRRRFFLTTTDSTVKRRQRHFFHSSTEDSMYGSIKRLSRSLNDISSLDFPNMDLNFDIVSPSSPGKDRYFSLNCHPLFGREDNNNIDLSSLTLPAMTKGDEAKLKYIMDHDMDDYKEMNMMAHQGYKRRTSDDWVFQRSRFHNGFVRKLISHVRHFNAQVGRKKTAVLPECVEMQD